MTRNFAIVNEKGQEYLLNDLKNYAFLTAPSGLGYSYKTDYQNIGDVFIEDIRKRNQGSMTADLNFKNYDNYNSFVNFIESAETISLLYQIPFEVKPLKKYYIDVNIQSLGKSEKQKSGIITEGIILEYKSLWYEKQETIFKIEAKEREIRWNFRWASRFSSYDMRNIIFNNEGHVDAPFKVEIAGTVINPKIAIYRDGKLENILELPITINQNEKLLYSSLENEIYILKQNADGSITNLFDLDYISLQNENIFKLKCGISEIRLQAENDIVNARIIIYPRYKAV